MAEQSIVYSLSADFPGGEINSTKLQDEIRNSDIVTAIDRIDTNDDVVSIVFKDTISASDRTILDGDTTNPAGGLIAAHDNTISVQETQLVKFETAQPITSKPVSIGDRFHGFSHDFCDKTTWYGDSVQVAEKSIGSGDGSTTVFPMGHTNIIDLSHGKFAEEDLVAAAGFGVTVKVNGVAQSEMKLGDSSGDYTINYETGDLTFTSAPANGLSVTVAYSYSPDNTGSTFYLRPPENKKVIVRSALIHFTSDLVLNDTTFAEVWLFNPADPPNKIPFPGSKGTYKKLTDFIAWATTVAIELPAMGGQKRGMMNSLSTLEVHYSSPVELPYSAGAELRVWLENHTPHGGEVGFVVFDGYMEDEEAT